MTARSSTGEAPPAGPASQAYTDGGKVHGAVVRRLGAMILGGRFPPGNALPREEELAALFAVSRTSLRLLP